MGNNYIKFIILKMDAPGEYIKARSSFSSPIAAFLVKTFNTLKPSPKWFINSGINRIKIIPRVGTTKNTNLCHLIWSSQKSIIFVYLGPYQYHLFSPLSSLSIPLVSSVYHQSLVAGPKIKTHKCRRKHQKTYN